MGPIVKPLSHRCKIISSEVITMDSHQNSRSHTYARSSTSSSESELDSFTFPIPPYDISSSVFPADELFFEGQLLPLQPSARETTILSLIASSTTSPETLTTSSPNSTANSSSPSSSSTDAPEFDSLQRNSISIDDESREDINLISSEQEYDGNFPSQMMKSGYMSSSKSSSGNIQDFELGEIFKAAKKRSSSLRELVNKCLKKVNPLHKKVSQKHQQQQQKEQHQRVSSINNVSRMQKTGRSFPRINSQNSGNNGIFLHCFSGNFCHPKRGYASSPMWCSASHPGAPCNPRFSSPNQVMHVDIFSDEELRQSAIREAIAYCKNSMKQ